MRGDAAWPASEVRNKVPRARDGWRPLRRHHALPAIYHKRNGRNDLTDHEAPEQTAGGLIGKLAGKAKEAAGALAGDNDLAREGRLQQAQVDAETAAHADAAEAKQRDAEASLQAEKAQNETEKARLRNEVATQERAERIERDRREAERRAQSEAVRQRAVAEHQREVQESAADQAERHAEAERVAAAEETIRLERQARHAEAQAAALDPKEDQ